jgi:hypothetical protein
MIHVVLLQRAGIVMARAALIFADRHVRFQFSRLGRIASGRSRSMSHRGKGGTARMQPPDKRSRAPDCCALLLLTGLFCLLPLAVADSFARDGAPVDAQDSAVKTPAPAAPSKGSMLRRPSLNRKPAATENAGAIKFIPFEASAFPYEGEIPDQNKPFLDVDNNGRRGHTSPRGGVLWADQTYADKRVLLFVPTTFDVAKPGVIIVYFHGNLATLERDVKGRQHVPRQVLDSGLNAVLVAPQLAVNALDSSAGHFWETGFFARFLDEAATHLNEMSGIPAGTFKSLPVVIVAYSGGYLPAIFAAERGGIGDRLRGIILLDALFGEADRYADWIGANNAKTFFFSAYSRASSEPNTRLRSILDANLAKYQKGLPPVLNAGTMGFLPTGESVTHNDFVTHAWTENPLKAVLSRITEFGHAADANATPPTHKNGPR